MGPQLKKRKNLAHFVARIAPKSTFPPFRQRFWLKTHNSSFPPAFFFLFSLKFSLFPFVFHFLPLIHCVCVVLLQSASCQVPGTADLNGSLIPLPAPGVFSNIRQSVTSSLTIISSSKVSVFGGMEFWLLSKTDHVGKCHADMLILPNAGCVFSIQTLPL